MQHESPLCVGIAWDHDKVYWVFDGFLWVAEIATPGVWRLDP